MDPIESLIDALKHRYGLDDQALAAAAAGRESPGTPAWRVWLRKKLVTEVQLLEVLGELLGLPFWADLPLSGSNAVSLENVPLQFLKRHTMVPLTTGDGADMLDAGTPPPPPGVETSEGVVIAVNGPEVLQAVDDLVRLLGSPAHRVVLAPRSAILSAINIAYDLEMKGDSAEQLVQDIEEGGQIIIEDLEEALDLLDADSEAPVIRLVNHVIAQSVRARASDIHIEPYQDSFKVRYRVDGILYDMLSPPKFIQPALVSRIKVMAQLNIAEKRLPQDGRMDVRIGGQEVDIRVSTIPTSFGERVVMRLLNKSGTLLTLPDLGLSPERLALLETLVASPNGIILVTGPTGSGKTTTLYAVLSKLNSPDINIITIEDPVEYQIAGISQIQVNPKIDLTFARGLRSIVRQDPDVILVGEIRDRETADIAIQSALTGHLVFSTLHTNDAASAVTRLVDIGVEPFLIASSLLAVEAQRLVRVLCVECKCAYDPEPAELMSVELTTETLRGRSIYRPVGCPSCINTGFRGRLGIFELMQMNDPLRRLVLETHDANRIKQAAVADGMVTLRADGRSKVLDGLTPIAEVLRVAR